MDSLDLGQSKPGAVLIVGPGAVGLTIGARLNILGVSPWFLGRGEVKEPQIKQVTAWGKNTILQILPIRVEDLQKVSVCFFAVKAFQLEFVLAKYLSELPMGCCCIIVSNGATDRIITSFQRKFPNLILRIGYCLFGTTMKSANSYELTSMTSSLHWGPLLAGSGDELQPSEATLLQRDKGIFFHFSGDARFGAMKKWVFNTVMNSLSGALDLPKNRFLLDDLQMLRSVYDEAFMLHRQQWPDSPWAAEKLWDELLDFIEKTGENENSMRRDRVAGRLTESAFLAGRSEPYSNYPLLKSLHRKCIGM